MLHRNELSMHCRGVIKYFSCSLGNAVPNDHIIVRSVKMPFTEDEKQWRCRLSACLQAGGEQYLNINFSHALSICRLVD